MSAGEWPEAIAAALASGAVTFFVLGLVQRSAPATLTRTNVSGRPVPAVGGLAVTAGSLAGISWGLFTPGRREVIVAAAVALVVMFAAGLWDDLRGDERPRGFGGHLRALGSRSLTGGIVKIAAGAAAGLVAGVLVAEGGRIAAVALVVAAAANFVNLTDRAPGRAAKVLILATLALLGFGAAAWRPVGIPLLAALLVVVVPDLREHVMLGDAGANPAGAVVGLGLSVSLSDTALWATAALLVLLNLASERWSYSAAIERTPPLRALDRWGRRRQPSGGEASPK